MATVYLELPVETAIPATTAGAAHKATAGTNFPVRSLAFDAATEETVYFQFIATSYGSGNITARVNWYADTASTADVIWGCAIAAITPDTDTQDIETKAYATAQTVTDTHLGTVGQRLHTTDLAISNLDAIASGDWVSLKFYRDADAAGDTMAGDAFLVGLRLSYSDT